MVQVYGQGAGQPAVKSFQPYASNSPNTSAMSTSAQQYAVNTTPKKSEKKGEPNPQTQSFIPYTAGVGDYPGMERAWRAAQMRSGIAPQSYSDIDAQTKNFYQPNLNVAGTPTPKSFNDALAAKQNLKYDDFGIPKNIQEQMKVQEAQPIMSELEMNQDAMKRQMAKAGILNDSAYTQAYQDQRQKALSNVFKGYSNIAIQSALKANEQRLANLNEIASLGLEGGKFTESGRQFNVGAQMDKARLDRATAEWAEKAKMDRSQFNEAIAEFLEDYDLNRLKVSQGLISEANETTSQRLNALRGATSQGEGGFGGFASGLMGKK